MNLTKRGERALIVLGFTVCIAFGLFVPFYWLPS